ncbi:MAG: circadian clock protein KaiC, partial [Candidatus Aminicenantes bacterium]
KRSKVPTGIEGFDQITLGGLPTGRITLLQGLAGSGKTVFGLEFLVRGVRQYNEPGVLISFEETEEELTANSSSFGFNLQELVSSGKMAIDYMSMNPAEFMEAERYSLDGLLVRIEHAVSRVGAKRILLDGIPALFYGFSNALAVRAVLLRLYDWLKERGLTTVVTAESETEMIRHGLNRSLPDCIVLLTERISNKFATRYLQVAKYRGSSHGAGEFPFLIGENGISLIPVTSIQPAYGVSSERITTGVPQLDSMLGGQGYYRGTSILVSGEAGTGKTSLAAQLAQASCQRGERCLYFAFEESEHEIIRNMRSIGIDFQPWLKEGLLKFRSSRATMYGLEMHLVTMNREINAFQPQVVILDPVTNLLSAASFNEVQIMVSRMIDFLKGKGITGLFTTLTGSEFQESPGEVGVSSLMDTWIVLRNLEMNGERTRLLNIWKSRGMAHDSKVREFLLTDRGVELVDVYAGPSGILTGTARVAQQEKNGVDQVRRKHDQDKQGRQAKHRRAVLEAQIVALRDEIEATDIEMEQIQREAEQFEVTTAKMHFGKAKQPGRRSVRQEKKS